MKKLKFNKNFANQLFSNPENFIDTFGLRYANDSDLSIHRLPKGKAFYYTYKGKPIRSETVISRINALVIPPAWLGVKIAYTENSHIQAVGRDAKNRKQYKYHVKWTALRNQTKFYKMFLFGKHLPNIREKVDIDLNQPQWNRTKVLALIIRLLEETHIRIGNSYYAKNNKTYGLSTLRSKHLHLFGNKMKFEFVGKKGKEHSVTIRNKKLIKLVNKCEEIPGWELFKYYDEFGEKHTIDSSMVNEYLQSISGELFSAKDFRTWSASLIAFKNLMSAGIEKDSNKNQKNIIAAIDEASQALGNTRNVSRKYYVHPKILQDYSDGSIKTSFNKAISITTCDKNFSETEMALMSLIENYQPTV